MRGAPMPCKAHVSALPAPAEEAAPQHEQWRGVCATDAAGFGGEC
jgi:hypothetical protein